MRNTPELAAESAAALATHAVDCVGDLKPIYGEPLPEIVAATAPGRHWLEAAVLAGYVPHLEGIELALRGAHALHVAELRSYEAEGVLGDALLETAMADGYRELSAMLEWFAAEMERCAAEINRRPPDRPIDETLLSMWEEDAREAELRALRAEARAQQAAEDNQRARQLRDRYPSRKGTSPVSSAGTTT